MWHACGAIKKFGTVIDREYPIQNYDYVLSNSDYWKEPYSQAFGITQKHVMTTGMPRVDCLCQKEYLQKTRKQLLKKYPMLEGKRVILYAPTFRGNIYKGFQSVPFDALKVMKSLGEDDYLLYKFHPLLKDVQLAQHDRIINMNHEDTHALFTISDILVSDFSSIIFLYLPISGVSWLGFFENPHPAALMFIAFKENRIVNKHKKTNNFFLNIILPRFVHN